VTGSFRRDGARDLGSRNTAFSGTSIVKIIDLGVIEVTDAKSSTVYGSAVQVPPSSSWMGWPLVKVLEVGFPSCGPVFESRVC